MNKQVFALVLIIAAVGLGLWAGLKVWSSRLNPDVAAFHDEAEGLIRGLQEYRKFVGNYPTGTPVDIAKSLSGEASKNDKKFVLIAVGEDMKNDKGEILDPWGTPIEFFFSHNAVLIRSAGPNRIFEDSSALTADDLYRSVVNAQDK